MTTEYKGPLSKTPTDYAWARSKDPISYIENIVPTTQGSTTTISSQSSFTEFNFLINDKICINLHRSKICGTYTTVAAANNAANFMANRPMIDHVLFSSQTGVNLVNMQFCQQYFQICTLRNVSWAQWLDRQLTDCENPIRCPKTGVQAIQASDTNGYGSSDVDFHQRQQLRSTGANVPLVVRFEFVFGRMFPDTFFGIDMDVVLPEPCMLIVAFAAETTWLWSANRQDDCSLGAAQAAAVVGTLTNCRIHLMTQKNPRVADAAKALFRNGFQMPIPYTMGQNYSVGANAGNLSYDFLFSSAQGSEVRYLVWSLFNATMTGVTCIDNANVDPATAGGAAGAAFGPKLLSFQTFLDTVSLEQQIVNCGIQPGQDQGNGVAMDYELMKKAEGNSPLVVSQLAYQQNWHWYQDFSGLQPVDTGVLPLEIQKPMLSGGVALSGKEAPLSQSKYTINATLPAATPALALRLFATFTKTLTWTDVGFQLQ